jgi:hypothetical protein
VACHVQRCFLHAWCPTDADLEFAVRRQHLRTPSGPTCPCQRGATAQAVAKLVL